MKKRIFVLWGCLVLLFASSMPFFGQNKQQFKLSDGTVFFWFTNDDTYWGVESDKGKIIVPDLYKEIYVRGELFYCTKKKDAQKVFCEVYYRDGTLKIQESDGFSVMNFFKSGGKWFASGTSTTGTNWKDRKMQYRVINGKGDYLYKYVIEKDSKGFQYAINEIADTIVVEPGKYTSISVLNDVIKVKYGKKEGVLNLDGSVIIPPVSYSHILRHGDGFTVSKSTNGNGIVGYYDRNGICIIPPTIYTEIYSEENGTFHARRDGKTYVIDSLCNVLLETKYQGLDIKKDENGNKYYVTYLGNGRGKMALDGTILEEAQPTRTETLKRTKDGFAYIEVQDINGLSGIHDTLGRVLIPYKYRYIFYYTGGNENQKKVGFKAEDVNGNVAFYDLTGKMILPGKYHSIHVCMYNPDYFEVEVSGRKGLCDKNGKEIIKPIYDDIFLTSDNQIYANLGIMKGVLDFKGKVVVPFKYTEIYYQRENGNYKVELFGYDGICSSQGKLIIPPKYTSVVATHSGSFSYYSVKDGNTTGLYTMDGKMLFPATLFEHVVISQAGSFLKSIGIKDEWAISAWNGNEGHCYYDLKGNLVYDSRQASFYDKYFDMASSEFDKKNFSSAINYFKQAINIRQSQAAYYNIAVSYYNMGSYKDAIQYFKKSQEISSSQELYNKAGDLILKSREYIQSKRRDVGRAILLGLIGSALTVGSMIVQSNMCLQNYNTYSYPTTSSSSLQSYMSSPQYNSSMDYLIDPNYAIYQTQQQVYQEYLQFTQGGSSMSYDEFLNLRGQAIYEMNQGSNNSNSNNYTNNSSSYSGKLSPEQYQQQYTRYENLVKSWFGNLSHEGKYTDRNGNIKGNTESDMPTAAYVTNKTGLHDAQKQMRRIRQEAEAAGVHIQESQWETATTSF